MEILLIAAILPVVLLCYFIYVKDVNKEPGSLLAKIFALGFFSAIPVVIIELMLDKVFPTESASFLTIFISTFFSVALVEEGFKWLITKYVGYHNKEFDEIYDIIVYSVFASLGFACIENILYVFQYGLGNSFLRAIISVPGHTCFAVIMGYFFAQAKVASMNQNDSLVTRNITFSLLAPTFFHTLFDAFLFSAMSITLFYYLILFFVFYIGMVVFCFSTVNKISKIQQNITTKVESGVITNNGNGQISYNAPIPSTVNYCPICGQSVKGYHFCPTCGFHLDHQGKSS